MTTIEFWSVLGAFNTATCVVQAVWLVVMVFVTCLVFVKPGAGANLAVKVLLSFAFTFNGIVFFLMFCDGPVYDFFFAPLFFIIAILFAVDIFVKRTEFKLPGKGWRRWMTFFWLLLWLLYPLVGVALGRAFPQLCTPMNPCPLTVFAVAMAAAAIPKVDRKTFIMLLPWALMGLPKCLGVFDCREDCILFTAGVYGLVVLIANWRAVGKKPVA